MENERIIKFWTIRETVAKRYSINLDAEYQRDKVWSEKDRALLIDSIRIGMDIPKIYLAENNASEYDCIDGKQRLLTIFQFIDSSEDDPLRIEINKRLYSYKDLEKSDKDLAKKIMDYELTVVILKKPSDNEVREMFKRLQLGEPLNSAERINAIKSEMRDFIFNTIGKKGPFFGISGITDTRFSREFVLAQIVINSFVATTFKYERFSRARGEDLEIFFENYRIIDKKTREKLERITEVLRVMDKEFGNNAKKIKSRAVAVSTYLFIEELVNSGKEKYVPKFIEFFLKFLEIKARNVAIMRNLGSPTHKNIILGFEKYIIQASAAANSIQRRHEFLRKMFKRYLDTNEIPEE
jgi:hypothetical protein